MKISVTLFITVLVTASLAVSATAQQQPSAPDLTKQANGLIAATVTSLPLSFEPNEGQVAGPSAFVARARGYTVHLVGPDIVLGFSGEKSARTDIHLQGGNHAARLAAEELLPGKSNYYIGAPANWHVDVPQYRKVRAADVYSGIDVVFYGNQRQLEYDFEVRPGADPSAIRLAFDPTARIIVNPDGDLGLSVAGHDLLLHRPVAYQVFGSGTKAVAARYVVTGHEVAIALGAYDRRRALVIDPTLTYATYVGGSGFDTANAVATDSSGNAYMAGQTCSASGLPSATNAYKAKCDAYVTAVKADGTAAIYTTYIGGSKGDNAKAIAVDGPNLVLTDGPSAVVVGTTNSTDFPTAGVSFQSTYGGGDTDAFVARLDATGHLVYSSFLGGGLTATGNGDEDGNGVMFDAADNIVVVGQTGSSDFPKSDSPTVILSPFPGPLFAAFITKLNAPLYSTASFSRFFEVRTPSTILTCDSANSVAKDLRDDIYIGGTTIAECKVPDNKQALAAKFSGSGSFVYGWISLDKPSEGHGIAVDFLGNAVLVGSGTDAKTSAQGALVEKINAPGSDFLFSNLIGASTSGGVTSTANAVAVDGNGFIYVTGATSSPDFPVVSPTQTVLAGGQDAFLVKLDPSGAAQIFSTFFGGTGSDTSNAIAVPSDGSIIYVAGSTLSLDLPVKNALQPSYAGNSDAFLAKWTGTALPYASVSPLRINFGDEALNTSSAAQVVTLKNKGDALLEITGINASGQFAQTHTCGMTVAPDQSCTISVTFQPTSTGIQTGAITVVSNAGTQAVTLTGNGIVPPDFGLSVFPTSNTVSAGGSATYTVTVTPQGGFARAVALTCSGLPASIGCSFSPTSVTLDGTHDAKVTVTVSTQRRASLTPGPLARPTFLASVTLQLSFGILGIVAVVKRKKSAHRRGAGLIALALLLGVVVSCSTNHDNSIAPGNAGGGSPTATPIATGTAAGSYPFAIVGATTTAPALSHQVAVSLTVN